MSTGVGAILRRAWSGVLEDGDQVDQSPNAGLAVAERVATCDSDAASAMADLFFTWD